MSKADAWRTDNSDGTIMIIDLEERRVISINTLQKTYATATFDEIKAAMKQAMQQMQQQLQQQPPPQAKSEPNPQNVQVNLTPKFDVTPGAGSRVILGVPTNETIMHMDLDVSATATPQPGDTTASGQPMPTGPQTVNGTMTMTVDMFMAPSVPGYQEIGEFYHRMATEINWVPPSNIHVDPRADSGPHRAAEKFRRVQGPADARNHQHGHEYSARTANRPANPPANRELAKYSLELLPAVEYLDRATTTFPPLPRP